MTELLDNEGVGFGKPPVSTRFKKGRSGNPKGCQSALNRYRKTARMALQPWMVEAALARLGDRCLTREQQKTVIEATRTPDKVRWPDWWEIKP